MYFITPNYNTIMKHLNLLFTTFLTLCFPLLLSAQGVAVNADNSPPNNSAMLDVKSTTKGMLIPRMTTAQRGLIGSPATGLLVFDNDTNSFWFFNGTAWTELISGTDSDNQTLNLTGSTLSISGGNSVTIPDGDITDVTAGTGLTGGGTTGNVTLNAVGTNGLTTNADDISLGGSLNQATTITQGNFDMNHDLTGTGNFNVQDNGTTQFSVQNNGDVDMDNNSLFVDASTDRVGVGTNAPSTDLHVQGSIRMVDGNQQAGRIMTSDANGVASWQAASTPTDQMILSSSFALSEDDVTSGNLQGYGTLTGDDVRATATMPFSITLDGNSYNVVNISSNGWIRFGTGGSTSSDLSNDCLPTAAHTNPFVAAYWDDLVTNGDNIEYGFVGAAPNRVFVITCDARTFSGSHEVDFQIQIHETSGLISVRYFNVNVNAIGQGATIGYQGINGKAYPLSCNGRVLDDNTVDNNWSICPVR